MKVALLERNKLGFVDRSVVKKDFEGELQKQWERCNAIMVSWLMSNVNDLEERFDKVNTSRAYHLHKSIATITQGVPSVSVYYSKLKDLWDEHDSIVPPPCYESEQSREYIVYLEHQKLFQFLIELNDGYSQARSHILMMNPKPNVNQVYAMVIQDES
ncbi:uncharacterized protein [Nicotiana sylvestris]